MNSRPSNLTRRRFLTLGFAGLLAVLATVAPAIPSRASEPYGDLNSPGTPAGENSASEVPAGASELVRKVEILTATRTMTALVENEPGEIDLALVHVPGAAPALTQGVTAMGFSRYVKVDGALIGQLVLSAVEKNGKREALNSESFTAQFDLEKPELETNSEIVVEGDAQALIDALERLAGIEEEEKAASDGRDGVGAAVQTAASNGGSNQEAAAYQSPEPIDWSSSEAPTVRVTTEGCSIRVDLSQMVAIQQSRVETSDQGKVTTSECEDGNDRYLLQRSYSACADRLDLDGRTATAQYQLYYEDAGGSRVETGECTPDEDRVFAIVESSARCATQIDAVAGTATPQVALVYTNASNAEVQVRGCAPSDTPPATLERDYGVCTDAIDVAAMSAYARYVLYFSDTDGARREAGACVRDEDLSYEIKPDYSACTDKVDLSRRVAYGQYRLYYTDGNAVRRDLGECTTDIDQLFNIVEDRDACSVYLDYSVGQAVPRAALEYADNEGELVRVRGCEASEEVAAVPLVSTTASCTLRHDFDAGISYRQSRFTYELDGTEWDAGACSDDGTEYEQAKLYQDASGSAVCAPVVDAQQRYVTQRYRLAITVDDVDQYISECTPDTDQTALTSTTEGCTNATNWTHDLSAGVSYGQERFYYTLGGKRAYVSECQSSTAVYPHQVETTGWESNDAQLVALPLSTVTIDTPAGPYTVAANQLLAGAEETAYTYVGAGKVPTGETWYEGCTQYAGQNDVKNYTRPDGTSLQIVTGAAEPLDNGDKCTRTTETRENYVYTKWDWVKGGNYFEVGGGVKADSPKCANSYAWCPFRAGAYTLAETYTSQSDFDVCAVYTGSAGRADMSHYDRRQSRTITKFPDGSEQVGAWTDEGGVYLREYIQCSKQ